MADFYVDPLAAGANNGTSWGDAWVSPASIDAARNPGDNIYVRNMASWTWSQLTFATIAGTLAGYVSIIGCNNTTGLPDGTIQYFDPNGGAGSSALILNGRTFLIFKYIGFKRAAAEGLKNVTAASGSMIFDGCDFANNGTNGVTSGATVAAITAFYVNCIFQNNATSGYVQGNAGGPRFMRCKFRNNTTTNFTSGTSSIQSFGCIFIGSATSISLGAVFSAWFENCVITGATVVGVAGTTGTNHIFKNCIIANCLKAFGITTGNMTVWDLQRYNNTNADTVTTGVILVVSQETLVADPFVSAATGNYSLNGTTARWTSLPIGTETLTQTIKPTGIIPIPDFPAVASVRPPDTVDGVTGTQTALATDADFLLLEAGRNTDPTEALVIKDTVYKIRGVDKLGSYYSSSAGPDSIQGKLTLLIKLLINAEVIIEDPDSPGQYVLVNYDNDEETELRKCALKTLEGADITVSEDEICVRERTTVTTDPVPLAGAMQTKLDLLIKAAVNKMANVEIPAASGKYYRVIYDDNGRSKLVQNPLKTAGGNEIASLKNNGDINIREASTI